MGTQFKTNLQRGLVPKAFEDGLALQRCVLTHPCSVVWELIGVPPIMEQKNLSSSAVPGECCALE